MEITGQTRDVTEVPDVTETEQPIIKNGECHLRLQ